MKVVNFPISQKCIRKSALILYIKSHACFCHIKLKIGLKCRPVKQTNSNPSHAFDSYFADYKTIEGYTLQPGGHKKGSYGHYNYDLDQCATTCTEDLKCGAFIYGELPRIFCFLQEYVKHSNELKLGDRDFFDTRTYIKIK